MFAIMSTISQYHDKTFIRRIKDKLIRIVFYRNIRAISVVLY